MAPTRCQHCDNDIETGGCRCVPPDPRWTTPVELPEHALRLIADHATHPAPLQVLINVAVYGRAATRVPGESVRRVKPALLVEAFRAAQLLTAQVGALAREAMHAAGFDEGEVAHEVAKDLDALHAAFAHGTSVPACLRACVAPTHPSAPPDLAHGLTRAETPDQSAALGSSNPSGTSRSPEAVSFGPDAGADSPARRD